MRLGLGSIFAFVFFLAAFCWVLLPSVVLCWVLLLSAMLCWVLRALRLLLSSVVLCWVLRAEFCCLLLEFCCLLLSSAVLRWVLGGTFCPVFCYALLSSAVFCFTEFCCALPSSVYYSTCASCWVWVCVCIQIFFCLSGYFRSKVSLFSLHTNALVVEAIGASCTQQYSRQACYSI